MTDSNVVDSKSSNPEAMLAPLHQINPETVDPTTTAYLFSGGITDKLDKASQTIKEKVHQLVEKIKEKLV